MTRFTLNFVILYYYAPLPPSPPHTHTPPQIAGLVATDKFKAPLFLYSSISQGWRFKMIGAYQRFGGRHCLNIYAQRYTTYEILLGA